MFATSPLILLLAASLASAASLPIARSKNCCSSDMARSCSATVLINRVARCAAGPAMTSNGWTTSTVEGPGHHAVSRISTVCPSELRCSHRRIWKEQVEAASVVSATQRCRAFKVHAAPVTSVPVETEPESVHVVFKIECEMISQQHVNDFNGIPVEKRNVGGHSTRVA
ncbi:hypothetical protein B0H13DRAFT_1928524 [Mycena leptocephala]|nr:hypothetical protein B0H13DRAFT_1928524 [Mycena leptocephala]